MALRSIQRYGEIDALRALAALLVLWLHSSQFLEPFLLPEQRSLVSRAVFQTVDVGRAGVVLFFAVSGFVIPASLTGSWLQGAKTFLIRRFFRLYPAFWLSVFATVISLWLLGTHTELATIAANLTMAPQLVGEKFVNPVYWTLGIELVFYAICLGFFLLRVIDKPAAFAGLIVVCALIWMAETHLIATARKSAALAAEELGRVAGLARSLFGDARGVLYPPGTDILLHLPVMALGTLCRMQIDGQLKTRWLRLFLALNIGYWMLWIWPKPVWKWFQGQWGWLAAWQAFNYAIPISIFVLGIRWRAWAIPALQYIGRISYSIYLLHLPIIYVLILVLHKTDAPKLLPAPEWALTLAVVTMTVAVSALTFRFVEEPLIALGRRLSEASSPDARQPEFASAT